jgi:hypothetical protein
MLTALGVPWIARKAIASSGRKLHIEHEGLDWTETIITKVMTKTMHIHLDGTPTVEISPVDKSQVTGVTQMEKGGKCVTRNSYAGSEKSQLITRVLEENGDYAVINCLTLDDGKVIETKSVYNKI